MKKRGFMYGDTVKLSAAARRTQTCPEGREDNRTAKVRNRCPSIGPGAMMLERDLHGCQFWNVQDLVRV